jgi:KDO2-lipid IV(A) lauroyltransferase
VVSRIPIPVANVVAWGIAWTWWTLLPIRRGLAISNVRRAFPEFSGVQIRQTLVAMMHNIALFYMELLIFERRGVRLTVDNSASIPPGSLVVAGHAGAWDIGLLTLAHEIPLATFVRTPKDPWVSRFMAAIRDSHGLLSLETGAGMAEGYAALEAGRSLMFIQDQRFNSGIPSPFFGVPCKTSPGLAVAHIKTGRPVYACWQARRGPGKHRFWAMPMEMPALTGDKKVDVQAITDACNAYYAARIREYPSGWLWLHDRWR